jgi:hypothetical protein
VDPAAACPSCGRAIGERQEYCLECGSRLPRPLGRVAAFASSGIGPSLAALVLAAGGAAAAIAATHAGGSGEPHVVTALPSFTPSTSSSRGRGRLAGWPGDNGFTIVLAQLPVAGGGTAARQRARVALAAGLPQVGILRSSNFASLHPGYYAVFSGVYGSRDDAEAALPNVARRFPTAAVREVAR